MARSRSFGWNSPTTSSISIIKRKAVSFSIFSSFSWKRGYSRWSKYPAQPEKVLLYHKENQLLYSLNLLWELHSACVCSTAKTIESSSYFLVFTCFNIFGFNSIIANEQDCRKTCQRGWYFTALRWRYMDGTSLKCSRLSQLDYWNSVTL